MSKILFNTFDDMKLHMLGLFPDAESEHCASDEAHTIVWSLGQYEWVDGTIRDVPENEEESQ